MIIILTCNIDWQITSAQLSRASRGDCNYVGNILMMLCVSDIMKSNTIRVNAAGSRIGSLEEEDRLTGCDKLLLLYDEEADELARGIYTYPIIAQK